MSSGLFASRSKANVPLKEVERAALRVPCSRNTPNFRPCVPVISGEVVRVIPDVVGAEERKARSMPSAAALAMPAESRVRNQAERVALRIELRNR